MAELPKRVYTEVWAARLWSLAVNTMERKVASAKAFTDAWSQAEAALSVYARVEQKYPKHELVAHKRLGTFAGAPKSWCPRPIRQSHLQLWCGSSPSNLTHQARRQEGRREDSQKKRDAPLS
jgi:hypothetical protein